MPAKKCLIFVVLLLVAIGLQGPAAAAAPGSPHPGAGGPQQLRVAPDPLSALPSPQRRVPQAAPAPSSTARSAAGTGSYVTVPADFPTISVTTPASSTAPGLVFVAPFLSAPSALGYLLMLDNSGQPVYYQRLPNDYGLDFKVLPDGTLSYLDAAQDDWVIMDSSYHQEAVVKAANGLTSDGHELQLMNNGHYLIMADQWQTVDMSKMVTGGYTNTQVLQQIIQEVDITGTLYFSWPILSHVPITDTNQPLVAPTIDYSHCNAIDVDSDGNLLLSCRHLSSVIKIAYPSGNILWHLGGVENNFTFALGPGLPASEPLNFYYQHDIRRIPDGDITLFDDHDDNQPQVSRALEYRLDEQHLAATLVRAQHHSPDTYSVAMGNVELLPNEDIMVGWGYNYDQALTEYRPDGSEAFEIQFSSPMISYRSFRFPWIGHPTWPPVLVAQTSASGIKLTFSWNGATDVAAYRIYAGSSSTPTLYLGQQAKTGFETSAQLNGASANYCFYEVVPIDDQGQAGQPSNVVANPTGGTPSCARQFFPLVSR
jgi:hypothetical protein